MTRHILVFATLALSCTSPPEDVAVVQFDAGADVGPADTGQQADIRADGAIDEGLADVMPDPPSTLEAWTTGNPADVVVSTEGPGLILMGGGAEPDAAFDWWSSLAPGGDIVVIRVSGSDGYNDYLFEEVGGFDSVTTLKVDTAELADEPYVAWQIDHAEGVFIAGGNQWDYLSLWSGTALHDALKRVLERGGLLGGTSAGLAVLGDRAFSAERDTVYSDEALADPYNEFMQFEDEFLDLPQLAGVVTDSHFRERDRMGRLVAFVARMWKDSFDSPTGIGVDESTALLIGPQAREVVGAGAVYEINAANAPGQCEPGMPVEWDGISVTRTTASGESTYTIRASAGALEPLNPYDP